MDIDAKTYAAMVRNLESLGADEATLREAMGSLGMVRPPKVRETLLVTRDGDRIRLTIGKIKLRVSMSSAIRIAKAIVEILEEIRDEQ